MYYLDTSALAKLVFGEAETPALGEWLTEHQGTVLATSVIAEVELNRAIIRAGVPAARTRVDKMLDELLLIEVDHQVRRAAADLPDPMLGLLDAIHLASAYELRPELIAIVTYDVRMARAVDSAVPVVSPGADRGTSLGP